MKLITKKDKLETVAQQWKQQYRDRRNDVYDKLVALDSPTEQDVFNIIGNWTWTENKCTECKQDSFVVVQVGEEPDYDSETVYLCPICAKKAYEVIKNTDLEAG